MQEREQKWYSGMLGVTFNANEGRITIFRSMLEALGWPTYYRFLYNRKMGQIAVQACKAENAGAHRVTRLNETNSCEIKCGLFQNDLSGCPLEYEKIIQTGRKIIPGTEPCEFSHFGCDSDRKRKNTGGGCKPHSCPTSGRSQPIAKQSQFGSKSQQRGCLRGVWARQAKSRGLSCQLG